MHRHDAVHSLDSPIIHIHHDLQGLRCGPLARPGAVVDEHDAVARVEGVSEEVFGHFQVREEPRPRAQPCLLFCRDAIDIHLLPDLEFLVGAHDELVHILVRGRFRVDFRDVFEEVILVHLLLEHLLRVPRRCSHLEHAALDDQIAHAKARRRAVEHPLFDGVGRHQPDHECLFCLPDSVDARLGLLVHHGVPIGVEDDDRVCRLKVHALPPSAGREDEDEDVRVWSVELLYQIRALIAARRSDQL
mmetsp:Transcript_57528/g.136874  ORF Transcript_57528/g.136874 Transcript_57528/m.136874 type:complete len:246 (-) Transcript_57528:1175-1912(-)